MCVYERERETERERERKGEEKKGDARYVWFFTKVLSD